MNTENIYSVYVHKNLKNEKYYVGMTSQEPKKRWDSGWGYQNNSQMWKDIQESNWNSDWVHGILGKFTDKNEALKYEAFLIAMLNSAREGYNISAFSSNPSEETKKKMSEAMTGRVFSEEHKKKLSESMSGKNNPFYGKHHSEQSKKRMSENRPSKPVLQFSKIGEFIGEYPSSHEAERQTGCNHQHICDCCKGKRKSCGGYIWQYKNGGLI